MFANAMSVRHVSGIGRQIVLQFRSGGRISTEQRTDGILQLSGGDVFFQRGGVLLLDLSVRQVFQRGFKQLLDVRCELLFGRRRFRLHRMSGNAIFERRIVRMFECPLRYLLLRGEPHLQPPCFVDVLSEHFGMRRCANVFGQQMH